jgi:hypothetical protein
MRTWEKYRLVSADVDPVGELEGASYRPLKVSLLTPQLWAVWLPGCLSRRIWE